MHKPTPPAYGDEFSRSVRPPMLLRGRNLRGGWHVDWECACGRVNNGAWLICPGCQQARAFVYEEPPPSTHPALPSGEPIPLPRPAGHRTLGSRIGRRLVAGVVVIILAVGGSYAWKQVSAHWKKLGSAPPTAEVQQRADLLAPDGIERGMGGPSGKSVVGPKSPAEARLAKLIPAPATEFVLLVDKAVPVENVVGKTDGSTRAYGRAWKDSQNRVVLSTIVEFASKNDATAYSGAPRSQFKTGIKRAIGYYKPINGRQRTIIEIHRGRLVALVMLATTAAPSPVEIAMLKVYARDQAKALR